MIIAQVKQIVVINHRKSEIPQPASSSENVTRQTRILCEVNKALKGKVASLNCDLMAESFDWASKAAQSDWQALLKWQAEFFTDLAPEETNFCSGIYFGSVSNCSVTGSQQSGNSDAIGRIRIDKLVSKGKLDHFQIPM